MTEPHQAALPMAWFLWNYLFKMEYNHSIFDEINKLNISIKMDISMQQIVCAVVSFNHCRFDLIDFCL